MTKQSRNYCWSGNDKEEKDVSNLFLFSIMHRSFFVWILMKIKKETLALYIDECHLSVCNLEDHLCNHICNNGLFMEQLTNYSMVNILYLLFKITEVIIPNGLVDISFCKKQTWDKCYIILLPYVTSFLHRSYVAWEIDANCHYVLIILLIERFFLCNSKPWDVILFQ